MPDRTPACHVSIRARPIGRAMLPRCWSPSNTGFNPRPANWPGDAPFNCTLQGVQSAAMAQPRTANYRTMRFQSAPGQLAGRCRSSSRAVDHGVSIRARPIGRAMPIVRQPSASPTVSIRARPIGRAMRIGTPADVNRTCFNPRPANWPGDARDRYGAVARRFNPRPANWPGDAPAAPSDPGATVSIRARPIGRAMRCLGVIVAQATFQSAPGQLAGRCPSGRSLRGRLCFNPRPANWPGDAPGSRRGFIAPPIADATLALHGSFNPRPANWPGDAVHRGTRRALRIVSIRARPIGRAMPAHACVADADACSFNPRPANWPGDARAAVQS